MNTEDKQNKELLRFNNFKKGDEVAFKYFFHKFYNNIVGFCVQFIHNENDAKEIAQEAFLNLWNTKEKINSINGVSSFLYTFSKSKCLNILRHKKVKERYINNTLNKKENNLHIEVLQSLQFDTLTFTELEKLIANSIDDLPEKTKEIFKRKRFQNKKNKEIAKEMDISIKTVELHFSKAIKVLKTKLAEYIYLILISILLN